MTMRRISKYNLRFNYFQESEDRQTHIQYIALLIVVPPQLTCGRVVHALVVVLEQTLQFLRVLSRVRTVFLFQVGGPGVSVSIYIYIYIYIHMCLCVMGVIPKHPLPYRRQFYPSPPFPHFRTVSYRFGRIFT